MTDESDVDHVKPVFLFYTSPFDNISRYTNTLCNHSFVEHSTGMRRPSLTWSCTKADSAIQVASTLAKLAVKHLDLWFHKMKVRMK
jgi:hypothetical protein